MIFHNFFVGETLVVKVNLSSIGRKFFSLLFVLAMAGILFINAQAATLSPALQSQLAGLANSASVGVVIVSFNTSNGLQLGNLNTLRGVGITKGVTFQKLGMVGAVMNAGQIRALANNPSVRSIWSNDQQQYFMNQARMVTGVDKLRGDSQFTFRNGGFPD